LSLTNQLQENDNRVHQIVVLPGDAQYTIVS